MKYDFIKAFPFKGCIEINKDGYSVTNIGYWMSNKIKFYIK